ncbi:uncharacterized protein [Diadema setosum]|uniref:uncharacterized protein n=1 Tax=Diadema setosum TaxID=31175 RepID=UPI003B3AA806
MITEELPTRDNFTKHQYRAKAKTFSLPKRLGVIIIICTFYRGTCGYPPLPAKNDASPSVLRQGNYEVGRLTAERPNLRVLSTNTSFSWQYRSKISHRPQLHRRSATKRRRGLTDVLRISGLDFNECPSVRRRRAVIVFEGEPLRLLCDPCESDVENIKWTKQVGSNAEQRVMLDSLTDEALNRVVLDADMSLEIRRARIGSDDGIYRCKNPKTYGAEVLGLYHVEVIPVRSTDIREVRLADGRNQLADEQAIKMSDRTSVEVYTHWTKWGRCSDCDSAGSRVRLGYCYVIRDLDYYASGIPCQSSLVPDGMKMQILQKRKVEGPPPWYKF